MKGFIAYIPAGFPTLDATAELLREMSRFPIAGVEIGIPFSDPVADGPVIQEAYSIALKNHVTTEKVLDMLRCLRLPYDTYLMSYLNPLFRYRGGLSRLRRHLERCNVKGLVIPDLPLRERGSLDFGFPLVAFIAPNTPPSAIPVINRISPPFVYYIARYGVTGTHSDIPYGNHIKAVKQKLVVPLYVGFGISTPQQVRKVWSIADGVIVGSALIKGIGKTPRGRFLSRFRARISALVYARD